jgi:1,4-dihydroxy-2-naphthoate octaprenyltransferase
VAATKPPKSVITCDLEGVLETFNDGAAAMFGYRPEEVVGIKRVSLFSPGHVVLGHVGGWLAAAVRDGEHRTRTAFVRKDGSRFAAEIKITPTFKTIAGVKTQIGYCGVTVPLPDVDPADAAPAIGLATRLLAWLVVTRAPFLTAAVAPVLIAAAWVAASGSGPFPWGLLGATLVAAAALHVAANTFNDYFDWRSGTDQANAEYFLPFSGGSRAIELGLITESGLLRVALTALAVAALAAVPIVATHGAAVLWFGLAGALSGYFYTAPPLRLVARRGLGEGLIALNFGPLLTGGTVWALTGQVAWADLLLGLPIGLLTTAILWINQFPDAPSDAATGKRHLVVVLGKARARWGYVALMVAAFGTLAGGVAFGVWPAGALLALLALPMAVKASRILFRHYLDRRLVAANALTIQLHLVAGLLMAAGLLWGEALLGALRG